MNTAAIQSLISAGDAAAERIRKTAQWVCLSEGVKGVGVSNEASSGPVSHSTASASVEGDPSGNCGDAASNSVA